MTIDHPVRRVLARVCSDTTMSRVVDPIFADMRWEDGRATFRGCVSLAKALVVHGITSVPGWCAAVWMDDAYAMPKAAGFVMAIALLASVPLLAPPLSHVPSRRIMSPVTLAAVLLPQALALTLP